MTNIPATIGRIVIYKFSASDADAINKRRADAQAKMHVHRDNSNGAMIHVGNKVEAGDESPATIVRVWTDKLINLKVFMDGSDDYWATSRELGDGEGQWHWMEYQKGQAAKTEAAEAALKAA